MAYPFAATQSTWSQFKSTLAAGRGKLFAAAMKPIVQSLRSRKATGPSPDRFLFEGVEPRLLFAADPLITMTADSPLKLNLVGDTLQVLDNTDQVINTYDINGSNQITIQGTTGDDQLTVDDSLVSTTDPNHQFFILFEGGTGQDSLSISDSAGNVEIARSVSVSQADLNVTGSDIALKSNTEINVTNGSVAFTSESTDTDQTDGSFDAAASISLESGSTIYADDITLTSTASSGINNGNVAISWGSAKGDIDSSAVATVTVDGYIETSGTVDVTARVYHEFDVSSASNLVVSMESTAKVDIGSSAEIRAYRLGVNANSYGDSTIDALNGASITVNTAPSAASTKTTSITVADSARMVIGDGGIEVNAIDESDIQIAADDLPGYSLSTQASTVNLNKTTEVTIGSASIGFDYDYRGTDANATVEQNEIVWDSQTNNLYQRTDSAITLSVGIDFSDAGWTDVTSQAAVVSINVQNSNGVSSQLTNSRFTTVNHTITDEVKAVIDGATIIAGALAVKALGNSRYQATAKEAINSVDGDISVELLNSTVFAGAVDSDGNGVALTATDSSTLTATANGLIVDFGSVVTDVEYTYLHALNGLDRSVSSSADNSDIQAANGNILVSADNDVTLSASAQTHDIDYDDPSTVNVIATAEASNVFVGNYQQGTTEASVSNSTVNTSAGDLTVSAQFHADISSVVTASSTVKTDSFGVANALLGETRAFNLVGWSLGSHTFFTLPLDTLIGTDFSGTENASNVSARLIDTGIDVSGITTVSASDSLTLDAEITSTIESDAQGFIGGFGLSGNAVIAGNKLSSQAIAVADLSGLASGSNTLTSNGGLRLSADNESIIGSTITLITGSSVSNTNPIADSDAIGVGFVASVNDVRGGASASLTDAVVNTGTGILTVSASDREKIFSVVESSVTVSGGSLVGTGEVYAINGVSATNLILSGAYAGLLNSSVTAGDISIAATDESIVDAKVLSNANSGDTAVAAVLAFNSIGWESQNILFHAVDSLVGASDGPAAFGSEQPSGALAEVKNTDVVASGNLSVTAESLASINATLSNAAESDASALFGASGMAAAGLIASNKVSSQARAIISNASSHKTLIVNGADGVAITATDAAGIHSNIKIVSSSITTNDGGASKLDGLISGELDADYTAKKADDYGVQDIALEFGKHVRLSDDYDGGGIAGHVYKYLGPGAGELLDLNAQDYSNTDYWKEALATDLTPDGYNISDSDSSAAGISIVLNDVRSEVEASLSELTSSDPSGTGLTVGNGSLSITATSASEITATIDSSASSSGGSVLGDGVSTTILGAIATNVVLGSSLAFIENSAIAVNGVLNLSATNSSLIDSSLHSVLSTGADGYAVFLSFNSIGYDSQNVLFNILDGLLALEDGSGNPLVDNNTNAAAVKAYLQDTSVDAGDISITAANSAVISSSIDSSATSAAYAFTGANAFSANFIMASNRVLSETSAGVSFTGPAQGTIDSSGNVVVSATDAGSEITSDSAIIAGAKATNDGGLGVLNDLINTLKNDYQFTSKSGTRAVEFGDVVRVVSDDPDVDDVFYQYMGTAAPVDLGSADYSHYGYWKELDASNVIPSGVAKAVMTLTDTKGGGAKGYSGLLVRNDVESSVTSYLLNADLDAVGSVELAASLAAVISARENSNLSANSAARLGLITNNQVNSGASATVENSSIDTTAGHLDVLALNNSSITSEAFTSTTSNDGITVLIALNTIGWDSYSILSSTVDQLIGHEVLSQSDPVSATALVKNSDLVINGIINVSAETSASITSSAGIDGVSKAKNDRVLADALVASNKDENKDTKFKDMKFGASGKQFGAILASNRVNAETEAVIEGGSVTQAATVNYQPQDGLQTLVVGDLVTDDMGQLYRYVGEDNTQIDLGTADYQESSVWQALAGTLVVNADDSASIDSNSDLAVSVVVTNNMDAFLQLADNLSGQGYQYTTLSGVQTVRSGDRVKLDPDHSSEPGVVYEYIGDQPLDVTDWSSINFASDNNWGRVTGNVTVSDYFPNIGNLAHSDSVANGGVVALNDVIGSASSAIRNIASVQAGDIALGATENATITASIVSNVESSGGSAFGEGVSQAKNGQLATNLVLSEAATYIKGSSVVATGDVILNADNTSMIDATVNSNTTTGDGAAGFSIAFNTIGWKAQDILTQAVDALIGSPEFANLFDNQKPALVQAYIQDSAVDAGGDITLSAESDTTINATVSNIADSQASALYGASGSAKAGLLTSNMVNSEALAYIKNTTETVDADGLLKISADDSARINANIKLVSSSVTGNDGGAGDLQETLNDFYNADYNSTDSGITLEFGDRVRLADDFGGTGNAGSIYKYMGSEATNVDLSTIDYSDLGDWKEVTESQIVPQGLNVSDSESSAVGGLISRNDVRSKVSSTIEGGVITAETVDIDAVNQADITALLDSFSYSSGGSSFNSLLSKPDPDDTSSDPASIGANVTVATNLVLSKVEAFIKNSDITTSSDGNNATHTDGHLSVDAISTASIDATVKAATQSGEDTYGVTMAFNTVGWQAQNLLFNTLDTIIGADTISGAFGNENAATANAYIENTKLSIAGNLALNADMTGSIKALVSNEATSAASALVDASGKSLGVILASNMVSSAASATIKSSPEDVTVAGDVDVTAADNALIDSDTVLRSLQSTVNDGGLSIVMGLIDKLRDEYQFTSNSGTQKLYSGSSVRLAGDFSGSGTPGSVYVFVKTDTDNDPYTVYEEEVDLGSEDYTNTDHWRKVETFEYKYTSDHQTQELKTGESVLLDSDVGGGTAGQIYKYTGPDLADEDGIDLGSQTYVDSTANPQWELVAEENLIDKLPFTLNVSKSESSAFGGMLVRNDVRGSVVSAIEDINLTARSVDVTATENATLTADIESTVESKGGSPFVKKGSTDGTQSLAANFVIATNTVQSSADAHISGGSVTTVATAESNHITVTGTNSSTLTANVDSTTTSNEVGVGVTLAFNTVGWDSQNILFNLAEVFAGSVIGSAVPAATTAYIDGSTVNAADAVSVSAATTGTIAADISNAVTSIAVSAVDSQKSVSVGVVAALNKLSTATRAYLSNTTSVTAGSGSIIIQATDSASITANVAAPVLTVGVSLSGSSASVSASVGLSIARNEIDNDLSSYISGVSDLSLGSALDSGGLDIRASESATIQATSRASAVSVTVSAKGSTAFAGGGASASNMIIGGSNAYLENSTLTSTNNGAVSLSASNSSEIDAKVSATAVAVGIGSKSSPAIALAGAYAGNVIGWDGATLATRDAVGVKAQIRNSSLNGTGAVTLNAQSTGAIDAVISATSVAVSGSTSGSTGAAGLSGLYTENKIATDVDASITGADDDDSVVVSNGDMRLTATDTSTINADAQAVAVAASFSGQSSGALGVGVSIARNTIANNVSAGLSGLNDVQVTNGSVILSASSQNSITAKSISAAVSVAAASNNAAGFSGGGSESTNTVQGSTRVFIEDSNLSVVSGDVLLTATSTSTIKATAGAFAAAVGASGSNAGAVSIGAAVANNTIGSESDPDDVYAVEAAVTNSSINASGDLALTAISEQTIDALIGAGSVGIAAAGSNAISASGAGVSTVNEIAVVTQAYIDGDGDSGIQADTLSVIASDVSAITAMAGAASIAASFAGSNSAAISVGVSLAKNRIRNITQAYAANSDNFLKARTGSVTVFAVENATISATSVAASVALSASGKVGVGLSGAGAESTNIILSQTRAYLENSVVESAGHVTVAADSTSADELTLTHSIGSWADRLDTASEFASADTTDAGYATLEAVYGQTLDDLQGLLNSHVDISGVSNNLAVTNRIEGSEWLVTDLDSGKSWIITNDNGSLKAGRPTISSSVISASAAIGIGGSGGVGASIGVSLARNLIGEGSDKAVVEAYTSNTSIQADGDLSITAESAQTIDATVAAGSAAMGIGGKVGGAISGVGVGAVNAIAIKVNAEIDGDNVNGIEADTITVSAKDTSIIRSEAGAASLAAAFSGVASVSLSVGVSLSENSINNLINASVSHADSVTARTGAVTVSSEDNATIDSISVAASLSVAVAAKAGISLSGAGAESVNKVDNSVTSHITNSDITSSSSFDYVSQSTVEQLETGHRVLYAGVDNGDVLSGDIYEYIGSDVVTEQTNNETQPDGSVVPVITQVFVPVNLETADFSDASSWQRISRQADIANQDINVTANNNTTIDALAGAAAAAVSGGTVAVSGAVGASIARNLIGQNSGHNTQAYVEESTLTSAGNIVITADAVDRVSTESYSGSVAIAVGIGAGVAGSGAEAESRIASDVGAWGLNATLAAVGDICILANSDSEITKSRAVGVAISASLGAASVAVSLVDSVIENTVKASIDNTDQSVIAFGEIVVKADAVNAKIDNATAITASVSGGAVGLSGGGIDINNTINNDIDAYLTGDFVVSAGGDFSLIAHENAFISGDATAITASFSLGAALGVALVDNVISSTIDAGVTNTTVGSESTYIHADSEAKIDKTATGRYFSVCCSRFG